MAMLAPPPGDVHAPIKFEDAKKALKSGRWDDESALRLVVQDALTAENYSLTKSWVTGLVSSSNLYQSVYFPRYWEGTQSERASVPFYTVAGAVNSLLPTIMTGLFSDTPPFIVQPQPGTRQDTARAVMALEDYQLNDIGFREELRLMATNIILHGTGIAKWGFETYTKERKLYERKSAPAIIPSPLGGDFPSTRIYNDEDIQEVAVTEYIDRPFFENITSLRYVLVDPTLNVPDIRKAKYVIHRMYLTWDELDKLRDRPGYKIPPREDLLALFFPPVEPVESAPGEQTGVNPMWDLRADARYEKATIDPFNEPLEVMERWDEDTCIVVLQKKLVIANDDNVYGVIPFLSCGYWDVPEGFFSMGLGKILGAEQRLQSGIMNVWLDQAALNLNGIYVRVKGKSIPTQSIRMSPGKIVEVDNKGDFDILPRQPAVPEAGQLIAMSSARVESYSGVNELMSGSGGPTAHSNLGRTAAGANLIGAGTGNRPAEFIDKLADKVIVPFLLHMHEMNRALLPIDTIRHILGEELQHEYITQGGDILDILNARVKFAILAGAKMVAKRAMAQALPLLSQYLTSPETTTQLALAGKKVDVTEIIKMYYQVSDWHNYQDVILPMTPEDQKRWQMMQPGAQLQAKGQQQAASNQQKFEQQQQLLDEGNLARAGRDVIREALKRGASPFATTGSPDATSGFGSNA